MLLTVTSVVGVRCRDLGSLVQFLESFPHLLSKHVFAPWSFSTRENFAVCVSARTASASDRLGHACCALLNQSDGAVGGTMLEAEVSGEKGAAASEPK